MGQLQQILAGLNHRQKLSILAAVLCIAGFLFYGVKWNRERDLRPLYSQLEAEDAAAVVDRLKTAAVEYKVQEGGTILVRRRGLRNCVWRWRARVCLAADASGSNSSTRQALADGVRRTGELPARHRGRTRTLDHGSGGKWREPGYTSHFPKTRFSWRAGNRGRPASW